MPCCSPGGQCVPVSAVLTGLVVDVAGEQVTLGELEVANDAMGCFAG